MPKDHTACCQGVDDVKLRERCVQKGPPACAFEGAKLI